MYQCQILETENNTHLLCHALCGQVLAGCLWLKVSHKMAVNALVRVLLSENLLPSSFTSLLASEIHFQTQSDGCSQAVGSHWLLARNLSSLPVSISIKLLITHHHASPRDRAKRERKGDWESRMEVTVFLEPKHRSAIQTLCHILLLEDNYKAQPTLMGRELVTQGYESKRQRDYWETCKRLHTTMCVCYALRETTC